MTDSSIYFAVKIPFTLGLFPQHRSIIGLMYLVFRFVYLDQAGVDRIQDKSSGLGFGHLRK